MRRNVRRLNREVGNIGGRDIVPETHINSSFHEEEENDKYDKENSSKKNSKSRKAVNLAGTASPLCSKAYSIISYILELQRYFRAAAEAAHEVLAEQGASALDSLDMNSLTDRGKALDSPSRMVALNLANGNPLFRYVDLNFSRSHVNLILVKN